MVKILEKRYRKMNVEEKFKLADRVLAELHQEIDEQIEKAQHLEVKRAMADYKAGRGKL